MADVIEAAKARIRDIERELRELKDFIEHAERVSALLGHRVLDVRETLAATDTLTASVLPASSISSEVPTIVSTTQRVARGSNPPASKVIDTTVEILKAAGRPMNRRELHEALAARGLEIVGVDPVKALGVILWRHRNRIVHAEGRGYWPDDIPVPEVTADELFS